MQPARVSSSPYAEDSVAALRAGLEQYGARQKNSDSSARNGPGTRGAPKIHALTRISVTRQNPDLPQQPDDSVAESMQSTEKAISEVQEITGW